MLAAAPGWTERRYLVALLGLAGVMFFLNLGVRPLWDIDEGMHAVLAQNMALTGDWLTPRINGEPFLDKPVLYNWMVAVSFKLLGFDEFAARLPAAASALVCVLITYLLGRRMFGPAVGFLAGVMLATSLEFVTLARAVQYDIPLTLFTTLAIFFFHGAVTRAEHRRRDALAGYAACALAVLVKGPIGLLLPGIVIGTFLLVTRRLALVRALQLPLGLLMVLAICAPWYLLMNLENEGFIRYFLMQQNLGNFTGNGARHAEPVYYYLPVLVGGLFPWSALLPLAFVGLRRTADPIERADTRFLLVWLAAVFLFLSASTSKLDTYILPLFPAACLLTARGFSLLLRSPGLRLRQTAIAGLTVMLALMSAFLAAALIDPPRELEWKIGLHWLSAWWLLLGIAAMLGIGLVLLLRRKPWRSFAALSAILPLLLFSYLGLLGASVDSYRSSREIAIALDRLLPAGAPLTLSPKLLDSALFYTAREAVILRDAETLEAYLASDMPVYVLVRRKAGTFTDVLEGRYPVIAAHGNKAIFSNRPRSDPHELPSQDDLSDLSTR